MIMECPNPALRPAKDLLRRIHARDFYRVIEELDVQAGAKAIEGLSNKKVKSRDQIAFDGKTKSWNIEMVWFAVGG